jgi:hypothetical protein
LPSFVAAACPSFLPVHFEVEAIEDSLENTLEVPELLFHMNLLESSGATAGDTF